MLKKMASEKGFSIIEILVVASVMFILIGVSGMLSSRWSDESRTEEATLQVSGNLNIMKMKALRTGVEHRLDLAYESGCHATIDKLCNFITITTSMGDANRASASFLELESNSFKLNDDLTVVPDTLTLVFQPNGNVVDGAGAPIGTVTLLISPSTNEYITKCGMLSVNPLGRINVSRGTWLPDESPPVCLPIREDV